MPRVLGCRNTFRGVPDRFYFFIFISYSTETTPCRPGTRPVSSVASPSRARRSSPSVAIDRVGSTERKKKNRRKKMCRRRSVRARRVRRRRALIARAPGRTRPNNRPKLFPEGRHYGVYSFIYFFFTLPTSDTIKTTQQNECFMNTFTTGSNKP